MAKSSRQYSAALNRKLISLAVASCFVGDVVYANPTAPTVVNGVATFQQAGNLLQVTNSPNAIINWGSFSINANEITRFIQQSAVSAVLNRVVGQDPSAILGALQSNGRVFLVNPNGILFGAGVQIDVAGLVASTLGLSNADFLAGRMRFTDVPGAGSVVNDGAITITQGSSVYLVAPNITNSGIITSPRGEVILAAGKSVELVDPGTPNLRVEIVAAENEARNLGQIVADSGRIGIYAGLINHGGALRADTVAVGKNGEILLKANKNITLESGSTISASGAAGGVHGGGTVKIVAEDTLDMRRGSAVHVDGGVDGGDGGFLELSGRQQIALNGEFTGRARKEGYKHGSLLLDPLNINIGALGISTTISLASGPGSIVVKQDGTRVYVVRPSASTFGSDFLEVIDTSTNTIVATVDLGDGSNAFVTGMALSPDGSRLYAVYGNTGGSPGFIKVVDTASNSVVTTYGVSGPTNLFGSVVDSSNRIYTVGNVPFSNPSAAEMVVIDGATGTQLGSVAVGFNPQKIVINPSGTRVYVTSVYPNLVLQEFATGANTLLSSTTLQVRPADQTISADGSTLYLAYGNRIEVRSTSTMAVVDTIPIGADRLVVNGSSAYASLGGGVSVIDLSTKTARQTFAIGASGISQGLGFNASGNSIYAGTPTGNQVAVIGLNAGTDTTTGGAILYSDAPGSTLNLPVSALSGAWTNVSLAATNNVSVNSPLIDSSIPSGGTLTLTAGNDVNINAWIGEPTARFNHALTLIAGNNVNVNSSIHQGNQPLVLAADAAIPAQGITPNASGSVNIKALGAPVTVDTLGSMTVTGQDFNILGGTNALVAVNVGGLLDANLAGNVLIQAGSAKAEAGQTANASVSVNANAINIAAVGTITIAGGDNGSANAEGPGTNTATATANTTVTSAATLALNAGGALTIRGGDNNSAYASGGNNAATMNANATVSAGSGMTLSGASIMIRGGDNASAYASSGNNTATTNTNATVNAGGALSLTAAGSIDIRGGDFASATGASVGMNVATVNTNATVSAPGITLTGGAVTIRGGNSGSASAYGTEASNNAGTLNANASVSATNNLTVTATSLTVRGGNNNEASASSSGAHTAVLNANAGLSAGGAMTLNISGPVLIAGGDFNSASASSGMNTATLNANATVSAGTTLTMSATQLTVRGGDSADADASWTGVNTATTNVNATLSAGGNMTLTATSGGMLIRGGDSGSASASSGGINNATTNANALVSSGGLLTVNATGGLTVRGGNNASASASDSGRNTALMNTNASVLADAMSLTVAGPVLIQGGSNASAEASCCANATTINSSTINANATVRATNGLTLTITGGGLTVAGGDFATAEPSEGSGQFFAATNVKGELSAGGSLSINVAGGPVTVRGGDYASAYASASSAAAQVTGTTVATGKIAAGGNLDIIASSMTVRGGDNASVYANGSGVAGIVTANTAADGMLLAGGSININTGSLTVRGGNNASASANDSGQVSALVTANGVLSAGTTLNITSTGGIFLSGGNNAVASASNAGSGGANNASVSVGALVAAGGMATISAGSMTIAGGMQSSFERAYAGGSGANTAVTLANANIATTGDFSYTGGTVTLTGGVARTQGGAGVGAATTAEANAGTQIAGVKTLNISGDLLILGGSAFDDGLDATNGIAMARAILDPGALTISTLGDVMVTGGSFTGQGSAYSTMMALGPINLTIGGSTGLTLTGGSSTAVTADPSSPITFIFTGGGTQNIINNLPLDSASIQTALFISLSPPPTLPPPPTGELPVDLELVNQVLIKSVNESGNTSELQPTVSAEGPIDQVEKKKNEAPVCR